MNNFSNRHFTVFVVKRTVVVKEQLYTLDFQGNIKWPSRKPFSLSRKLRAIADSEQPSAVLIDGLR